MSEIFWMFLTFSITLAFIVVIGAATVLAAFEKGRKSNDEYRREDSAKSTANLHSSGSGDAT